jgi:hypothetical protein
MSLAEVIEFGLEMRRAQAARGIPWDQTSSAVGGFQITGSNIRRFAEQLGLDPNKTKFTPEIQRRFADILARGRPDFSDWEGFRRHEDLRRRAIGFATAPPTVGGAVAATPAGAPAVDPAAAAGSPARAVQASMPSGRDQSYHRVDIAVTGPEGTRSRIAASEGSAEVNLRQHVAMTGLA